MYSLSAVNVVYSKKLGTKNLRSTLEKSLNTFEEAVALADLKYPNRGSFIEQRKNVWHARIPGLLYPGHLIIRKYKENGNH